MGESLADPSLLSSPIAIAAAGLFGALWGSFFNLCIARVPRHESVVRPGSHCDSCSAPLAARDNIPIVSYLLLRGRCRACRAPFSPLHPVVEALAAALAAGLWWKFVAADVVAHPAQPAAIRLARFALYFAFSGVLVVLAFIDLGTMLLPDVITLPAIPVLYLAAFGAHDVPWLERLIGAAAGYLILRLVADFYYYVLKREGLGLGDAKLLAVIGAVLGWRALPFVVLVAGLVGAAVSLPVALATRRRSGDAPPASIRHFQLPFGPFLALAALVYLFVGPALLRLWMGG